MHTYQSATAIVLIASITGLLSACGGSSSGPSDSTSTGGAAIGAGGSPATSGGATNNGGAPTSGGAANIAGASTSGGALSSGGAVGAGGSTTGGALSSGGTTDSGGAVSSGGKASVAGSTSSGGTPGGGAANSGGATNTGGKASSGGAATGGAANSGGATNTGGKASGGATSGGAASGGAASGGAASGGAASTDAIRVPQMTGCSGVTSGLSASVIYYVTPNGTGDGSSFASGMSLTAALAAVKAGEMVLLQPGTYTIPVVSSSKRNTIVLSKSGTSSAPIYLVAANCGRAKFDFSYPANEWQPSDGKSFGFHLSGNYWYLKNIDVTNAGYHGIWIGGTTAAPTGGTYNTIENCAFYNNRNSGLEINSGGAHNKIINTDSYINYDFKERDDKTMGGMADGFASKQEQKAGNAFYGCRAWGNSDDGFDTFANTDPVTIEYSWAFKNGIDIWGAAFWQSKGATFKGNGNGFKLGGDAAAQRNRVVNSVAFGNPQNGFDLNSNTAGQTMYNNIGYKNGKNYDFDSALASGEKHVFKNNISLSGTGADVFQNADSANNTWNGISVSAADFVNVNVELATAKRNADGSLPYNGLFALAPGSGLINAGANVGLPYTGSAPDLGPFESK